MPQKDNTQLLENQHHFQMYRRLPLTLVRGKGTKVYDAEGKAYIDALAGIAVNTLGHAPRPVVKALRRQMRRLMHVSNIYYTEPQAQLAEALTTASGLDRVMFSNSGAEANEAAIKLARKYAHKQGKQGPIVSAKQCFHGRTLATIATGQAKYQEGFGPMPAGFVQVDYDNAEALEAELKNGAIAVILETLQGEGGINPPSEGYFQRVRQLCDEHGALLILDEVQCGIGRTGQLFAFQHHGIVPDILTLAKGLGSGFPIGAMLARQAVAETFQPGDHGTTYGGNPLACVAGLATLQTIAKNKLDQKAAKNGEAFIGELQGLASKHEYIKEVRGQGLMVGVELHGEAKPILSKLIAKGIIAGVAGPNVLRFVPPLIISRSELQLIVNTLDESLTEFGYEQA